MMIARTVSRSLTATRAERSSYGSARPEVVERLTSRPFPGLGCSLDEWDAVVATMPESLRPSVRGAHSAAFERAYVAWTLAQADAPDLTDPCDEDPTPEPPTSRSAGAARPPAPSAAERARPSGVRHTDRPNNMALARDVVAALESGPLTGDEVIARVTSSPKSSVRSTLYRLLRKGALVRTGEREKHGYSYTLTAQAAAIVAKRTPTPKVKRYRRSMPAEILAALLERPQSVCELGVALGTHDWSVRRVTNRLLAQRQIVPVFNPHVSSARNQRYAVATAVARAMRAGTSTQEVA